VAYLSSTSSGVPKKINHPQVLQPSPRPPKYKLNIVEPPKCCIFPSKTSTSPALKGPESSHLRRSPGASSAGCWKPRIESANLHPGDAWRVAPTHLGNHCFKWIGKSENPGKIMENKLKSWETSWKSGETLVLRWS